MYRTLIVALLLIAGPALADDAAPSKFCQRNPTRCTTTAQPVAAPTAAPAALTWTDARVLGAQTNGPVNGVAVQIGELAIVGRWEARWSVMGGTRSGHRAADLIVGGTVPAAVDGDTLRLKLPSGTEVRAQIVQRSIAGATSPGLPTGVLTPTPSQVGTSVIGSDPGGTPVLGPGQCIGAVVNGVCHGTPSPAAQIGIQTGTVPRCHGQMLNGQCTGPMF